MFYVFRNLNKKTIREVHIKNRTPFTNTDGNVDPFLEASAALELAGYVMVPGSFDARKQGFIFRTEDGETIQVFRHSRAGKHKNTELKT